MGFDSNRFIAGFTGSLAFQLFHPLDVLRTRLQSIDSSSHNNLPYQLSYKRLIGDMLKKEGYWALYRGTMFSMSMNIFLGLFFMLNERLKRSLENLAFFNKNQTFKFFCSSSILSFFFAGLYSPFYSVKTWLLLDINSYENKLSSKQAFRKIKEQFGYRGFYRGFFPLAIMGFNGTITVGLNDYFRHRW